MNNDLWRGIGLAGNIMFLVGALILICLCFAIAIL